MCEHTDPSRGHYEYDLDVQVETCIDEYEQDMRNWYFQGGPTDPELATALFGQAERFSKHVLLASEELLLAQQPECGLVEPEFKKFLAQFEDHLAELASKLAQKGLSPEHFLSGFREICSDIRPDEGTILKVVWELLLAQTMWDAVKRSRRAATRLLFLGSLRIPARPTDRTRLFLRQVARCFVLGLDVPCIIFCRSTIDAALEDAGLKGNLKNRIEKAPASLLDGNDKADAHAIRELGNDALHDKPLAIEDVLTVIRKTLVILQQITPSKG